MRTSRPQELVKTLYVFGAVALLLKWLKCCCCRPGSTTTTSEPSRNGVLADAGVPYPLLIEFLEPATGDTTLTVRLFELRLAPAISGSDSPLSLPLTSLPADAATLDRSRIPVRAGDTSVNITLTPRAGAQGRNLVVIVNIISPSGGETVAGVASVVVRDAPLSTGKSLTKTQSLVAGGPGPSPGRVRSPIGVGKK